jgi:signal transduction histidine kinase
MVEEKQLEAKDKKIKLKLDIPKQLPLVLASERYLEQAIVNLINNALVYTEKGSVTVKASKEKETVLIQIIDTGIGISKKDAARLFDKFVRARNATSTYTDGTGLGLFITKKIIDGHKNAKVWIEKTQLGKGTTFTISLPSVKQKA